MTSGPAIDRGISGTVVTDFDRKSRPRGKAIDIGAFEYGGSEVTIPKAPANFRIKTLR